MRYKPYGNTGKLVSALGFGGSRFSTAECSTPEGRQRYADLIVKAHEAGVNYFDTAPGYCGGMSEQVFGLAFEKLRQAGRQNFYVATKSTQPDDPTAEAVRQRIEQSLRALQMDKIHFFHMWGILTLEQYHKVMAPGGPYWGALKAKEEGLVEHICFSTHCTGEEIEKIIDDGYFEGVTLGYNAINFKFRERGLLAAKRRGLGVAIMNPLGGGVIPRQKTHFAFLAEAGESIAQAALRFVLGNKAVSVALSGMTNDSELEENLAAVNNDRPFTLERIEHIRTRISQDLDSLCTGCQYCNGCPQGIEIYKPMLSYNTFILSRGDTQGFLEDMEVAWRLPPAHIFDCIECGLCEEKCTQHLPIRERLAHINGIRLSLPTSTKEAVDACFAASRQGKKTGIYAMGNHAKALFADYEEVYGPPDFPLYLFDSDSRKWGSQPWLPGLVVRPPEEIETLGIERLIIASTTSFAEIAESLSRLQAKGVEFVAYNLFSQS
ncbi:aldo/keto reductase [Desulfovibrio sp. OttesenSCG-928-M14]|nr:aldo/keto reductase [Desulfovibrio sp. OttesenSCG-928-M14]